MQSVFNVSRWITASWWATVIMVLALSGCVSVLDAVNETPIEPDPGKRTFGAYVDDEQLETVIAVNLRKADETLSSAHINVNVFNGIALLTGEVPGEELRQLAGKTAQKISKVRQVHNELLIKSNSTFFSKTNDNWLHTKIRTKLIANRGIESDRVEIIVENRIVYIMGLLTQEEANLVAETAANVKGVEKVVRVVEYIQRTE